MDFHINEIDEWEKEIDPIYKKSQHLKQIRKELFQDSWAIHWMISQNEDS